MTKTKKPKRWLIARRIVQAAALLLFVAPLLASGWSLLGLTTGQDIAVSTPSELPFYGSLSASSIAGVVLLDPVATLEVMLAARALELSWLAAAGLITAFYAVLGGRVFCGWVCPVNLLLELVDWLRRRLRIQVRERALPRHTKIVVLLTFLAVAAILQKPLFENLSPIAAIGKSMLFGSLAGMVVLAAIVIAELFWARRVWCRSLCPVGGFYQLLGRISPFRPRIDHQRCTQCQRCQKACLAAPEILDAAIAGTASRVKAGDCMRCGACVDACPEQALRLHIR
jgi:ferredoxin-type protein NapH